MRRLVLTVVILGFVALVQPANAAELRIALVIGNGGYETAPLKNPVNDARLMAATLRGAGFEVIERLDADQKAMKRAIQEFGERLEQAGQDGVGLFYFSGHGVQVGGVNYLIPIDTSINRESDVDIEAVSANAVLGTMEFARNRLNIVILDACRNNPYARSFRSATRGLARMDAPRGTLVAYATAPGGVAFDGEGANSPYTSALVQAMQAPGLKVEEVFKQVRLSVMAETGEQQVPWEGSSLTGDFYFNPGAAAAAPAVASPAAAAPDTFRVDPMAVELMFWESIKDSGNPADFEEYLRQFPEGRFAGLARNRIQGLERQQTALVVPAKPAFEVEAMALKRGDVFKDCPECPEMVVVSAGGFTMGSPPDEAGRDDDEGPRHWVNIARPFALGKYEVTKAEFAAFVNETGLGTGDSCWMWEKGDWELRAGRSWLNPGFSQGNRDPVACVSWDDALAYVRWLSQRTGHEYRLPSEAEWEYAARAGTTTPFHFGSTISTDQVNYDGNYTYVGGHKGVYREKTAPVGIFPANAFGLHDVHGNVWEWVGDCWNDSYAGAPGDGSAWTSGNCGLRVLRGGSWLNRPRNLRSADRLWGSPDYRYFYVGFRVARTLP